MQGNDIGPTTHKHIACHFEGLLMHRQAEPEPLEEKGFFFKRKKKEELKIIDDDSFVQREMRRLIKRQLRAASYPTTKIDTVAESVVDLLKRRSGR